VVVFFYGGRWSSGAKAQYRFVAQALASKGLVAVIPDYRLYPHVRFPAFIEDGAGAVLGVPARRAVRWRSAMGFPDGHSAGACIAAMLALAEAYLNAERIPRRAIRGMIGLVSPY
jgi:acetyl esterase/lipase